MKISVDKTGLGTNAWSGMGGKLALGGAKCDLPTSVILGIENALASFQERLSFGNWGKINPARRAKMRSEINTQIATHARAGCKEWFVQFRKVGRKVELCAATLGNPKDIRRYGENDWRRIRGRGVWVVSERDAR